MGFTSISLILMFFFLMMITNAENCPQNEAFYRREKREACAGLLSSKKFRPGGIKCYCINGYYRNKKGDCVPVTECENVKINPPPKDPRPIPPAPTFPKLIVEEPREDEYEDPIYVDE